MPAAATSVPTVYRLANLRILSELPLPELAPCPDQTVNGDEVLIRRAQIPKSLTSIVATFAGGQCNKNELLLDIPEVGRYLLRDGVEILVEPATSAGQGDINAYLLGTMFGVLCHQRGITPLHGSGIDVANGCVVFVGEDGAGKSTLAAALAARRHHVICDDICFLRLGNHGAAQVWPGINRIRLLEDAAVAIGWEPNNIQRAMNDDEKYLFAGSLQNSTEPRRLRRVYRLQSAPVGRAPSVSRIRGAAAVEVLMQNVFRLELATFMGCKTAAFVACAAAARDAAVFEFNRPLSFDTLTQGIELLEEHLRDAL